jgi:acyl carrier protein
VPDEVPGEIFVGGGGVARGYLNREDLTAERFISNPFSQDPGARLYRTGDLAKIMANREVVYLGRRDNQVKIRGFRVELGEIESGVCKHPNIHEAVVICREYQSDFQSLTAYVVPKNLDSFSIGELKRYLQTKLPDYMIPSAFVTLEALPLTVNGKVDRAALPEPHFIRSEMGSAYVAPSNKIERTIAAIYQEILGLDEVGIYDNFFELGGNSLLVGRVVTELRKAIDADLEMVRLFEFPTVSALAKFLSGAAPEKPLIDRVVERAKSRKEAFARRRQFHGEKAK